jgi:hypothetical protein
MAKPDFFVIGAQRAGTTRLCALLGRHPSIRIPTKEPMYFHSLEHMREKASWYQELYADPSAGVLQGEGSTYYSMCGIYPGTAQRVHDANPAAKIIYMVRHPLRRIESAWVQLLSVGNANRVRGFDRTLRHTNLLIDPSLYWRQLSEYRRHFPDEQLHVEFFEEFTSDEQGVVDSCLSFLGAPSAELEEVEREWMRNESQGKQQRSLLVDALRALPGYERYKAHVPQAIKTALSERFTSPIKTTVSWKPETLRWTLERLRADSASLLEYTGRSSDYWQEG